MNELMLFFNISWKFHSLFRMNCYKSQLHGWIREGDNFWFLLLYPILWTPAPQCQSQPLILSVASCLAPTLPTQQLSQHIPGGNHSPYHQRERKKLPSVTVQSQKPHNCISTQAAYQILLFLGST